MEEMKNRDSLYDDAFSLVELLKRYMDGELTAADRGRLAAWLWEDRRHRELFLRARDSHRLKESYDRRARIDPRWEVELLQQRHLGFGRKRAILSYWRYAAACLILLGMGSFFYYLVLNRTPDMPGTLPLAFEHTKAVLHTASGEVITIDKGVKPVDLPVHLPFEFRDSVNELVYLEDTGSPSRAEYNELIVPRGGELKLILPDGTKVWLNSESSIRFPQRFSEELREIQVSGELYFEVTPDEHAPFVVRAGEFSTEVLGTRFGVRAYSKEFVWSTILSKGSVRVCFRDQQVVLVPGNKATLSGSQLHEEPVDLEKELAWVDGHFVFKHDRLEDVATRLSRWYDVDFVFAETELKDYRFTGNVSRDIGVHEILSLIERMNVVQFEYIGERIYIKSK